MKHFALIGFPLGHSMSPFIHKQLMHIAGIDGDYRLIEMKSEEIAEKLPLLKQLDGFNVTIPHKTKIIDFLSSTDENASLFGAVNTVTASTMTGSNTDCDGFLRALKGAGIEICGDTLVLGAGGVSRMIAFECAKRSRVTLAVRNSSVEKAEKIKLEIKEKLGKEINVCDISEIKGEYHLLVNGTPVGMYPNTQYCPVDDSVIANTQCVFDTIYNPEKTLLVKKAEEMGKKASNGMTMLVAQAARAQEIWNSLPPFDDECIKQIASLATKEMNK